MDDRTFWWAYFAALAVGSLIGLAMTQVVQASDNTVSRIISENTVSRIAIRNTAVITATKYGVDPILVLAIIQVESKGNPKATGGLGEIGLMQLRPEFHSGVTYEIGNNIRYGVRYLAHIKDRCPNRNDLEWITCYNKGTAKRLKHPTYNRYYKRVMAEYARLLNSSNL